MEKEGGNGKNGRGKIGAELERREGERKREVGKKEYWRCGNRKNGRERKREVRKWKEWERKEKGGEKKEY